MMVPKESILNRLTGRKSSRFPPKVHRHAYCTETVPSTVYKAVSWNSANTRPPDNTLASLDTIPTTILDKFRNLGEH